MIPIVPIEDPFDPCRDHPNRGDHDVEHYQRLLASRERIKSNPLTLTPSAYALETLHILAFLFLRIVSDRNEEC